MAVIFIRLPSSIASGFGGLFIFFAFRRNGYFKIESRPDARLTLPKAKLKLSLGWFVLRVACGTAVDPRSARRRKINHASSITDFSFFNFFLFENEEPGSKTDEESLAVGQRGVPSLWIISENSNSEILVVVEDRRSRSVYEMIRPVQHRILYPIEVCK